VLLGVFYAPGSQDYQVPCSRRGLDVSTGPNGICPTAVHRCLSVAVSSSRELSASFRVLRPPTCPACPRQSCDHPEAVERLLWGSSPSSRHQPAASTHARGIPAPSFGPSSAFLTPSTVCSATGLAGLFRPAATSRVFPSGVCPFRGAGPAFAGLRFPRAVEARPPAV